MTVNSDLPDSWKQRVEEAKRDILGPNREATPAPIAELARKQIVHAIEDVEYLILKNGETLGFSRSTAEVHISRIKEMPDNEAFAALQEAWGSTYLTEACERFVKRYSPLLGNNATAFSPS
jgi:hypothetical protein